MKKLIGQTQLDELTTLFHDCADALDNDSELNVDGNGVNALEAGRALQAVADILCVDGPMDLHSETTVRRAKVSSNSLYGKFSAQVPAIRAWAQADAARGRDDA